ncbi:hypothetical protein GGI43DRAFT_411987 [Trichoderma evansii]
MLQIAGYVARQHGITFAIAGRAREADDQCKAGAASCETRDGHVSLRQGMWESSHGVSAFVVVPISGRVLLVDCWPMAVSILRVITRQTDSALAKTGSHHLRLSPCRDPSVWRAQREGKAQGRLEKL